MGRVRVLQPETKEYRRSFDLITVRQKGVCWFCRQLVRFGDIFVSHGNKKTKYYHEGCARRVRLLY
jgi:hypothetical protein